MFEFNAVDWVLIVLLIVFAWTGWTQGFVVGLLSALGFVGGLLGGLWLAPRLLDGFQPSTGLAILAILVLLTCAAVTQGVLAYIGGRVRARMTTEPAKKFDALGGSILSVAGLLVVAWAVGLAISASAIPSASAAFRESRLLGEVNERIPVSSESVRSTFRRAVEFGGFPAIVAPYVPEPIVEVEAPSGALAEDPEVRLAADSVVKVLGRAECDQVLEGSAFVIGPERVLTNAHVVAGVDEPVVQVPGAEPLPATTVHFDPQVDVAVLAVPGLTKAPLGFREDVAAGADAMVIGYPNNGPLRFEPARVRTRNVLVGQDIYGEREVSRDVIALRGDVRSGNSGGPLVADDGRVYGVIFASSLTDPDTAYALTPAAVAPALAAAVAVDPVFTGSCAA